LPPGRIFTWWALTSFTTNDRSSSTYQTGFHYEPVASMAISVTPSSVNQSAIGSNEAGERGERASPLLPTPPARRRSPHAGDHLVLADVDPRAALDQHIHQ
jgi:hypothetical protein